MSDLKEIRGKNELDDLSPGFLWELGLVATHGNTKYRRGNWQAGERGVYIAAIMRHLLRFSAGEMEDSETGLHHMAHIARNAEFLYWHDRGDDIPGRACRCEHCANAHHSTSTTMGS